MSPRTTRLPFNHFLRRFSLLGLVFAALTRAVALDLGHAVVVLPASLSVPETKAAAMLVDEVAKRTGIRWTTQTTWPASRNPIIALGRLSEETVWPKDYRENLRPGP